MTGSEAGAAGGLEESVPEGDGEEEDEGLLFVGDRGKILCAFNGGRPKLIPMRR